MEKEDLEQRLTEAIIDRLPRTSRPLKERPSDAPASTLAAAAHFDRIRESLTLDRACLKDPPLDSGEGPIRAI